MATTPIYAFPYLASQDPPDIPAATQNLAQAVENKLQGALALGGDLTVPGNLSVTGNATITGNLTVSGVGSHVFVRKTANESVTSSTVQQDDDHLLASVVANATYTGELVLFYTGATAGDISVGFTFPANAVFSYAGQGLHNAPTSSGGDGEWIARYGSAASPATTTPYGATGGDAMIVLRYLIRTGVTAGTVRLQWAQFASSVTATTVKLDSHLTQIRRA